MENPKAFVSYAGQDRELAEAIARRLMAEGIETFLDSWEILAGDNFVEKLSEGLRQAEFFVLLLSPHSLNRVWPKAEQNAATVRMVQENVRVIPVNLGVQSRDLPPLLQPIHWVTLTGPEGVDSAVNRIIDGIYRRSDKPPLGPIPEFARTPVLDLRPYPDLSSADKTVFRILFEVGKKQQFLADWEEYAYLAEEKGIGREALEDSLEMLRHNGLLRPERGAAGIVRLQPRAVDECCRELLQNYESRRRLILTAAVNTRQGGRPTTSDRVQEATGEERWLVCHVLRFAETQGQLKMHAVFVGHEFYSIESISPVLTRALEQR